MSTKLQIAIYWGAGCGGCDVSILDTNEFILDVAAAADIRLWPIAIDGKYSDIEAMADGDLDLAVFNGSVRNSENEHLAKLLRSKSKLLVAFGSCAHIGGVPGLANLASREEIFDRAYLRNPSIEPNNSVLPRPVTTVDAGELEIPHFYRRVYKLADVVDVDYYVPGCPPDSAQVRAVLTAVVKGELPPRGSVVGASNRTVCDDCKREKQEKKITKFYRPFQVMTDPDKCLLEQGVLCAGSATRSGCGVRCPNSNMPCRGCYGPAPNVIDQGAKLLSAISAIVDSKDPAGIDAVLDGLPDFVGYAYRYGLPASLLERSARL